MQIFVQKARAIRLAEKLTQLDTELSSLIAIISKFFQQEVRSNIIGQGREYGRWEPASKWTRAKKGTSKLFEGMDQRVRYRASPKRGEVFFDSPGDWTLTKHQEGFVVPPTGALVVLDLKDPSALGTDKSQIRFISRNPSRVPARKMWPTEDQANKSATPLVSNWLTNWARTI